ncbi:methyl-accepting chemotaxis protein (tlpB), putative [Campylobacter jejuni subsp. doylei]|nr:methyl-accepting chemotaxis protein (tlpB), putative [Campylobacter jejuni subsp. doylei]
MDISHSLEGAQKDISKTSQSYIIIFTIALILPFVVLLMLKVVGKPVLELLIMLKN